jgi:hypothetical protein
LGSKNRRIRKEATQTKAMQNMEQQYTRTPYKKDHVERSLVV